MRLVMWGIVAWMLVGSVGFAAEPTLDADYPGGNIKIVKVEVEGDSYTLAPDLRDTRGWWFYWNFRVRGAEGRTLRFRFEGQNPIGVRGPAVSRDAGANWAWMGAKAFKALDGGKAWEFKYAFPAEGGEMRFCFAIPYQQSNLERFLARHRGDPALEAGTLCQSHKGRAVEMLRLGCLKGEPKYRVLLTARHHACESLADYEMEGIMESILEKSEAGRAWRENVAVLAVPFIDKDGVEDGDQGKNRAPHDHNRDYNDTSLYPEIRALRARVPEWAQGKIDFALDLHCPHIRGADNEHIYFVGGEDKEAWARVENFAKLLESTRTGPLPYHCEDNLPFGKSWNTTANYGDGKSFGSWARTLPGIRIASSLEFPYANVHGEEVSAESARAFGHDLARALMIFLEGK